MEDRQLWLLRNAKADWRDEELPDIDRPLEVKGIHDIIRLGKWMKQHNYVPDYIISSPAKRARQTSRRVCEQLGIDPEAVHYDVRMYMADRATLLEIIAHLNLTHHRVLLVGHNPGLEDLLRHLCAEPLPRDDMNKLLNTANLVRIRMPDAWSWLTRHCGSLLELVRSDRKLGQDRNG